MDIQLKPDYVPKVQQHFRLSEFDQRRLEYHEDIEVAEGKAEWASPGTSTEFGSPSFVVDQAGKGVLGRPVRDYRHLNSQTVDAAWPAADAEACMTRAQKGSLHSSFDCVWGFTQIGVTEETSKLLALVTRRDSCYRRFSISDRSKALVSSKPLPIPCLEISEDPTRKSS